jgi:hypothetical protein
MNAQQLLHESKLTFLPTLLCSAIALIAACDRPSEVAAPGDLTPQMAPGGQTTTVRFVVTRADAPTTGVPDATVSVYFSNTQTDPMVPCEDVPAGTFSNCWLTTGLDGTAQIEAPSGQGLGYLARPLPAEWNDFANVANGVWPPASPPSGGANQANNDLGALTCGTNGPVQANAGSLQVCVANLYVNPHGNVEEIDLPLPVLNARAVVVKDLNGNTVSDNTVFSYLIEPLNGTFPWQSLPAGVEPGFLRFYGQAGGSVPQANGHVEVYGKSANGFDIAGTETVVAGVTTVIVDASPVICANGILDEALYSFSRAATNPEFSFTSGKWAFGATRPETGAALDRDLTTSVVVLQFANNTSDPVTVSISQRLRTAGGTNTASGTAVCNSGGCTVGATSAPGAGNPMTPSMYYQTSSGKLFWVVQGLPNDVNAVSEWSAKATKQSGKKVVQLDQWPVASKSNASSAFQVFSTQFTFCDPDFSFDGGWGCGI